MNDDIKTDQPFPETPEVTKGMQAEILKHLAINWPARPCGVKGDMVHDALMAGARALEGTEPKMSTLEVLDKRFGLKLTRVASDDEIILVGVRVSHYNAKEVRKIWQINVSRRDRSAEIVCNGDIVLFLHGSTSVGPTRLERCAVSALFRILKDKTRCARHGREKDTK